MNNVSIFAACVLIWGTTWLAITFQLGPVAPEVSVSHRFLLAAVLIALWCRWHGLSLRFGAREHLVLALMGGLMYGFAYIAVYHAELHLASGVVAIGYSASPLLSALGTRLFLHQPITARLLAGAALGLAGIALVYWPELGALPAGRDAVLGIAFTFAAVLSLARAVCLRSAITSAACTAG